MRTLQIGQTVCSRPHASHTHRWRHGRRTQRGAFSSKQTAHSLRAAGWGGGGSARADPPPPQPAARNECAVCFDENAPRCVLLPCRHRCVCEACGREQTVCPICSVRIERVLEIFES